MNLLKYLKEAAKSEASVYTTFLQQYSNNNNALHVFHEGKDDPSFYGNFIQTKLKKLQRVYYYQAKNKDQVYANYNKLNWNSYSKKRVLFFVDKDYADILNVVYPNDSNIFITRYYSIENYLVDQETFARSIRDLIGLENENVNMELAKHFTKGLKTFHDASILLSAYIIFHKLNNNPINLKNINFSDVFLVSNDYIAKRKSRILNRLDQMAGVNTTSSIKSLREIIKKLMIIKNPKTYIRGKFELAYLVHCINITPTILNLGKKEGEKKYRCCVSLSKTNAIQIIAPRIKEPKEIKGFLNKAFRGKA
ncbi:MAG: DUF4435 domain-containing protein [Williamsia sp.]|nr:DUF4435 domain-containing protein [Williamsia sp.]